MSAVLLDLELEEAIRKELPVRVLVVDDFKPWLDFVNTMLDKDLDVRIVGAALDGYDAVAQAQILKPDVILMDICLPRLNGIDATRRITRLVPDAKILFVTQHRESSVVQAAMAAGGQGYIVKLDAGSELLPALESVIQGKRYFSRGLLSLDLTETAAM